MNVERLRPGKEKDKKPRKHWVGLILLNIIWQKKDKRDKLQGFARVADQNWQEQNIKWAELLGSAHIDTELDRAGSYQ